MGFLSDFNDATRRFGVKFQPTHVMRDIDGFEGICPKSFHNSLASHSRSGLPLIRVFLFAVPYVVVFTTCVFGASCLLPWLPWSVVLRYHGFNLLGVCSPSLCWCDCFVRALAPCMALAPLLILTSPASWSRHRGRSASCWPMHRALTMAFSNNDKPDSHIGLGVVWDSSSSGQTEALRLSLTHKRPSQHSYSSVVQHTRRVEPTVVASDGWASWRQQPCGDP